MEEDGGDFESVVINNVFVFDHVSVVEKMNDEGNVLFDFKTPHRVLVSHT